MPMKFNRKFNITKPTQYTHWEQPDEWVSEWVLCHIHFRWKEAHRWYRNEEEKNPLSTGNQIKQIICDRVAFYTHSIHLSTLAMNKWYTKCVKFNAHTQNTFFLVSPLPFSLTLCCMAGWLTDCFMFCFNVRTKFLNKRAVLNVCTEQRVRRKKCQREVIFGKKTEKKFSKGNKKRLCTHTHTKCSDTHIYRAKAR